VLRGSDAARGGAAVIGAGASRSLARFHSLHTKEVS
jgi:hypothetical protein